FVRNGRTIVVAPGTAFGARIAQEKLGVPLVTFHLQPAILRSVYDSPCYGFPDVIGRLPRWGRRAVAALVDKFLIDRMLAPEINAFRAELGLPPVRRIFYWANSPQLVLGLFPDWFAAPQPDWPLNTRLTGFPRYDETNVRPCPPDVEGFLASGE